MATRVVNISQRDNEFFASVDGEPEFFVGRKTSYKNYWGLVNNSKTPGGVYSYGDYEAQFGFWARFINPTAQCESNTRFCCINTYDRARFTFGFLQFAAHVPDGDFVVFLRGLLAMTEAPDYFPDLSLRSGRIHRATGDGFVALESEASTADLMAYLNPTREEVDEAEVINAARFIHWTASSADARLLQVDHGVSVFRAGMRRDHKRYDLDQREDTVCAVIADIHHQGRAEVSVVAKALASDDPYEALLKVGADKYPPRCATLRKTIDAMVAAGKLGTHRYDAASRQFVPK